MRLSVLRTISGWLFVVGHMSTFAALFLWALFWSSRGFDAISDIVPLLLPVTGVTFMAAVKAFWKDDAGAGSKCVSLNFALAAILIPGVLVVAIWCLIGAYVTQAAASPQTVKIGISICQLFFGTAVAFIVENVFGEKIEGARRAGSPRNRQPRVPKRGL
jgi:hypothetical protein